MGRAFVLLAQLYDKAAVIALAEVAHTGATALHGGLSFDADLGRLAVLVGRKQNLRLPGQRRTSTVSTPSGVV